MSSSHQFPDYKTQKSFMDYIKLSSEEIADEINAIVAASKGDIF